MEKFNTLTSKVCPIAYSNVDTDMIIPAQYLTSVSKLGYGENLFRRMRDEIKDFALNQPRYKDAKIMVADDNFACGSSREHAVWAIQGWGFQVVIAKSFADIFFSNSAKNGLLLITLPADKVDFLLQESTKSEVNLTINLEQQAVILENKTKLSFEYDSFRKHCLLQGLDDIDYILSSRAEIEKFRAEQG
jgi:3-isopropylmalate/(R)-2-methylmalate dehydratase small subunit